MQTQIAVIANSTFQSVLLQLQSLPAFRAQVRRIEQLLKPSHHYSIRHIWSASGDGLYCTFCDGVSYDTTLAATDVSLKAPRL